MLQVTPLPRAPGGRGEPVSVPRTQVRAGLGVNLDPSAEVLRDRTWGYQGFVPLVPDGTQPCLVSAPAGLCVLRELVTRTV